MKTQSIQTKFLKTVIAAMLAITIFVGGLGIYEADHIIQLQSEDFIKATCEREATQINDIFGDIEKSVRIMESYVLDMIENKSDVEDEDRRNDIIQHTDKMFSTVAKNTSGAIAYYLRFDPEVSDHKSGLFYSKMNGGDEYICLEPTDLSIYEKDDTEHVGWFWQPYDAGQPVWMNPYYNENNDVQMISYVVPMYYEGQFIGVIGMDFDYMVLIQKVHDIKIYEHGFAHLESQGALTDNHCHEPANTDADLSKMYLRVSEKLINGMELVLSASYDDIWQIRYDIALKMLMAFLLLVTVFSAIAIIVVRRIVEPLKQLTAASQQLANGNYDVESVHSDTYEIKVLSNAFENMAQNLREHKKTQLLLAYRDSLTGLRNATSYRAWITEFNKEIQNKDMDFGVAVFDLNYLKETNDRYGHAWGNKMIVTAAGILSDTFKRSPVFRIGGDEFLAILQNKDLLEYEELFQKLDSACAEASVNTGESIVDVSIAKGFSKYDPSKDTQFADVFDRADEAMYKNKREMKNMFPTDTKQTP